MCKRIILLRRYPEDSTGKTGLGVYSDNIAEGLIDRALPFEEIFFRMDLKDGFFRALRDGLIRPFLEVLKSRDRDAVYHATDELCCAFFPFIPGRKVVTVHHVVRRTDGPQGMYYRFWSALTGMGISYADAVIAVSPQTRREIVGRFPAARDKVLALYSPIRKTYRDQGLERGRVLGCIGELIPRKNTSSAIRAFGILSSMTGMGDLILRICGKGPEEDELRTLAEDLGLAGRVEFVSGLTEEEVLDYYNTVSVLLNPSLHEGFGFVTLEAQRCGTPVVYFSGADIPEEVTRFAVASEDERDMAEKAFRVLTDDDYREHVTVAAREYSEDFGKDFIEGVTDTYGL